MSRRPIEGGFDAGSRPDAPGDALSPQEFRDALSWWASTVTVVAARIERPDRVLATTVTSFAPVAADPPTVVVSLGASAQVLPAMEEGATFVVSLLARDQKRFASVYADPFPVGPSAFPDEGLPVVEGALVALVCTVASVHPVEANARLVTGRVMAVREGTADEPLLYWRRSYTGVAPE